MNDDMRNKAKSLFEEVETLQTTILEEKENSEKENNEQQTDTENEQDKNVVENEQSKENKNPHNMPNNKKNM